jgi:hypothetical protein
MFEWRRPKHRTRTYWRVARPQGLRSMVLLQANSIERFRNVERTEFSLLLSAFAKEEAEEQNWAYSWLNLRARS